MQASQKSAVVVAPSALQRARARAAPRFDAHAALFDEVGSRLLEHLDLIKLQPAVVLELGCATGRLTAQLQQRFAHAKIAAADSALEMLLHAKPGAARVCAAATQLPFAARCFDLIVCNLAAFAAPVDKLLPELLRTAAPGALLLLSSFGPDTLIELRQAFARIDKAAHLLSFLDMHDIGDALLHTGFAEPIVHMERLTLTYASLAQLTDELAALGLRCALQGCPRGLRGKGTWRALQQHYAHDGSGQIPATFEIVYATAWKPQQSHQLSDGSRPIVFHPKDKLAR